MNEYIKKPYYVDLSVTPFCNLKCPFCSAGAAGRMNDSKKAPFTLSKLEDIFNQFDENDVMRVSLEGGEPFTRPDIIDVLNLADKHNFWYMINTNATLITEELAKKISKTNVDKLCISIDGPEKIHDLSRGSAGSFNKMKEAVGYLNKYNVSMDGIITLTNINIDYLFETLELIKNMGISNVAIMLLASVGKAFCNKHSVEVNYNDWKKVYLKLTDLKKEDKLPVNVNIVPTGEATHPWMLYLPLHEEHREDDLKLWLSPSAISTINNNRFACTAGTDNFAIDGYGNVYGCSLMYTEKDLIAGNVYENSITDIWNNSSIFKKLREIEIDDVKGDCAECEFLSVCRGGCRVCSYAVSKDLYSSDVRCPKCERSL